MQPIEPLTPVQEATMQAMGYVEGEQVALLTVDILAFAKQQVKKATQVKPSLTITQRAEHVRKVLKDLSL